jgi:hypothetical protein
MSFCVLTKRPVRSEQQGSDTLLSISHRTGVCFGGNKDILSQRGAVPHQRNGVYWVDDEAVMRIDAGVTRVNGQTTGNDGRRDMVSDGK